MNTVFENYNLSIDIPDGTIQYDKDEATKALQLSKDIAKHCLVVLGNKNSNSTTSISYIGQAETKEDYEEIIGIFTEQNNSIGIRFKKRERVEVENGPALEILQFSNRNNGVISIFVCMKHRIFMANTNCKQADYEESLEFTKNLMKSLRAKS